MKPSQLQRGAAWKERSVVGLEVPSLWVIECHITKMSCAFPVGFQYLLFGHSYWHIFLSIMKKSNNVVVVVGGMVRYGPHHIALVDLQL